MVQFTGILPYQSGVTLLLFCVFAQAVEDEKQEEHSETERVLSVQQDLSSLSKSDKLVVSGYG